MQTHLPPEPVLKQILALQHSEENYLAICRRAQTITKETFKYRLLECLVSVLVTEDSLTSLRVSLQDPVQA